MDFILWPHWPSYFLLYPSVITFFTLYTHSLFLCLSYSSVMSNTSCLWKDNKFVSPVLVVENISTVLEQKWRLVFLWFESDVQMHSYDFCLWLMLLQCRPSAGPQSATGWWQKAEGFLQSCLHFTSPGSPLTTRENNKVQFSPVLFLPVLCLFVCLLGFLSGFFCMYVVLVAWHGPNIIFYILHTRARGRVSTMITPHTAGLLWKCKEVLSQ